MNKISPFVEEFSKETCREFYNYWTEKSENGKKMRFEGQKFFDIKKRLTTWKRNEKTNFAQKPKTNLENLARIYNDNSLEERYLKEEQDEANN